MCSRMLAVLDRDDSPSTLIKEQVEDVDEVDLLLKRDLASVAAEAADLREVEDVELLDDSSERSR